MRNSPEGSHTTPNGTEWESDKILGKANWYCEYLRAVNVLILRATEKLAGFLICPSYHYLPWSPQECVRYRRSWVVNTEGEISLTGLKQTRSLCIVGQWLGRGLTHDYNKKRSNLLLCISAQEFWSRWQQLLDSTKIKEQHASEFLYLVNKKCSGDSTKWQWEYFRAYLADLK